MAFVLPLNLLLFGIENLLFLWYPARPATAGDFQMMGRNMLLMAAKFLIVGLIGGITGLVGVLVYYLTELADGPSWLTSLTVAWLMVSGFTIGLVRCWPWPFVASTSPVTRRREAPRQNTNSVASWVAVLSKRRATRPEMVRRRRMDAPYTPAAARRRRPLTR
jgi:hypothetical protein